ncbi:hypothetical protein AB4Z01_30755 [Inquilinus sp. YAF38]|uniref:hypothetical protein n=1 Tax=Inquilinus sp. YAF38 TaxID=3233084 RepID=UPI003F8EE646
MIRPASTKARLSALCAALLFLPVATAGAQQALVPARPAQPDWFESNRTLQVLRAQQQSAPRPSGQGGLAAGEAGQIYDNYMQSIGKPLPSGNSRSYGGSDSGFGPGGMGGSSGGRP